MTASEPQSVLHVEHLFLPRSNSEAKELTPLLFYALASGDMKAVSEGEDVSFRYVVKKCLDERMTTHFQARDVVTRTCTSELERMGPLIKSGILSAHDVTLLGNILSLNSTSPFKDRSPLGELAAKTAHSVIHTSGSRRHKDLHAAAYMALSEWDDHRRYDADDWRRMSKGVEDKIAPALLYNLMKIHPAEFGRSVLQMLRPGAEDHFPEGTREKVFMYLRMKHISLPQQLPRQGFDVICDRVLHTCNEEERGVFELIAKEYAKQPAPDVKP